MSSIKESSLGLNYGWSYGETGWNSGMDENIVLTGFHANKQIKGILSTPPITGINNGDAYIVGSSPTGTWVGNYAKVAIYDRGSWLFATPSTGVSVYNKANGCWYEYNNGWSLKPEAEESPYIKVKDFDFSTGYVITNIKQALFNIADGKYYLWNGTVPKTITKATFPVDYNTELEFFTEAPTSSKAPTTELPRVLSFCSINDTGYVSGNTIAYFKADHDFTFPDNFEGSQSTYTVIPPLDTLSETALVGIFVNNVRIGSVQFNTDGTTIFIMYETGFSILKGDIISFKVDTMTYIGSFTLSLVHTLGV